VLDDDDTPKKPRRSAKAKAGKNDDDLSIREQLAKGLIGKRKKPKTATKDLTKETGKETKKAAKGPVKNKGPVKSKSSKNTSNKTSNKKKDTAKKAKKRPRLGRNARKKVKAEKS
ncbi:MAG: hypothetical protein MJK04_22735, partial [Psychrosphaera sp.]|nr:hypothetical protein [Psychrosphaera sp.]